jgi:aminomethyltransferase
MSRFLRATPFHARAAGANRRNNWVTRNDSTLSNCYSDINVEALAARTRVAIADISWRWRVAFQGVRVVECLQCLLTRDVSKLAPGAALKALWLSDGGGVRGAGVVARYGRESFLVASTSRDRAWFETAAAQFEVTTHDVSAVLGGLAIIGPYARATLQAAGLDTSLEPLGFRKLSWRGIEVTVSRWGEHGGYEIWCGCDDALILWDRVVQAGAPFGLEPVGVAAMEVLDIEAGIPRPGRDYAPAYDGEASEPLVQSLGLDALIDTDSTSYNGRSGYLAMRAQGRRRLVGVQIDSDTPAPQTPLLMKGHAIGQTLSSAYSPALRRAIALAQVDEPAAKPGMELLLTLPTSLETPEHRLAAVQIVTLPFLQAPETLPG